MTQSEKIARNVALWRQKNATTITPTPTESEQQVAIKAQMDKIAARQRKTHLQYKYGLKLTPLVSCEEALDVAKAMAKAKS